MQKRSVEVSIRRLQRAGRRGIPRLPEFSSSLPLTSGSIASSPARLYAHRVRTTLARALAAGVAAVREVGPIGFDRGRPESRLYFYTNTLPFELVSISETRGNTQDALLGLKNTTLRVALVKLGDERITLTQASRHEGQAHPDSSRSFDLWFRTSRLL